MCRSEQYAHLNFAKGLHHETMHRKDEDKATVRLRQAKFQRYSGHDEQKASRKNLHV
jgi:hypothetical protein